MLLASWRRMFVRSRPRAYEGSAGWHGAAVDEFPAAVFPCDWQFRRVRRRSILSDHHVVPVSAFLGRPRRRKLA
eukprot:2336262-Pleurochrysis_carterae.AAC.1